KKGNTTVLGLHDNQFEVPSGSKYALFILSFSTPQTTYKFRYMLLENNEDKNISYFEGLKSVGQGDKIEVLSCNGNLITNDFELGDIAWGTGLPIEANLDTRIRVVDFINVL